MEKEADLYNFEELASEANGYHGNAERLAVEHGLSFSEAMELAVAEDEAIELVGESGADKVILAPLAALTPLTQSSDNEGLEYARYGVRHYRERVELLVSEKVHSKYSSIKVERLTNLKDIGRFIGEWVDSNQTELVRLGIEDWRQLTPPQSALLSARIVNTSLKYDDLAGGYKDLVPEELRNLDDAEFTKASEERSAELDNLGMHQLLRRGSGVCRHYGHATEFVFRALKSLQNGDRLSGTEVFCVNSLNNELDTSDHNYNLILVADGKNLHVGIFDSLHVDGQANDLCHWRREIDKFHTRTASTVFNLAAFTAVVDIITERGEDRVHQWFEQDRRDSARLFNALSFTLTAFSRHERRETDLFIDFIDAAKEGQDSNNRLLLELYKLRRAKYFRHQIHSHEELKHLRIQARQELKPVNEAARSEIESRLEQHQFNPELMARKIVTRVLPIADVRTIGQDMDEDDIRYDIEQGLGFVYYRTVVILSQTMLPFLPDGINTRTLSQSIEKNKAKFLKAHGDFVDELTALADQGQLGDTYLKPLAELVGIDEFIEVLEQGADSFAPTISIFQLTDEEEAATQVNQNKGAQALSKIKSGWAELKKAIKPSSNS